MKLKPCPFCGGRHALYMGHEDRSLRCASCGAKGPQVDPIHNEMEDWPDIAVELWNKRYTQEEVDAMIAEVRK